MRHETGRVPYRSVTIRRERMSSYCGRSKMIPRNSSRFPIDKRGVDMPDAPDQRLLEALLDSWDRNNTILLNLLRALPEGGLEARATDGSPSIAEMFTHIHFVRLVLISEDAPEFGTKLPDREWVAEHGPDRIAQMLDDSAKVVRNAVQSRVEADRDM